MILKTLFGYAVLIAICLPILYLVASPFLIMFDDWKIEKEIKDRFKKK